MRREKKIPLFLLDRPLGNADIFRTYRRELAVLQGNILKSHGREATISVFLTFKAGKVADAKRFVRELAPSLTSAKKQAEQSEAFKESHKTELFTTFHLTAPGYRFLNRSTAGFSKAFREGLRAARKRLGDPPVSGWDAKFRKPIHAMVTLAHDYQSELERAFNDLRKRVERLASVSIERGLTMRNEAGWSIEHFGFVDGLSQPLFFDHDVWKEKPREQWDPAAGPNLVLVKDPHGQSDSDCGSYIVFRKLEQNVKAFKQREKALARQLHRSKGQADLAGALIMGRFRDGRPAAQGTRRNDAGQNDFTYELDHHGDKCPLFAHIRKTNPRGDSAAPVARERCHRIARRGITYGNQTPPGEDETTWPEKGVGLLFQCCQADVMNQFEFIQRNWANNPDVVRRGAGQDALIGQSGTTRMSMPADWGDSRRIPFDVGTFVCMRGGEYFFAPSIAVLKRI